MGKFFKACICESFFLEKIANETKIPPFLFFEGEKDGKLDDRQSQKDFFGFFQG